MKPDHVELGVVRRRAEQIKAGSETYSSRLSKLSLKAASAAFSTISAFILLSKPVEGKKVAHANLQRLTQAQQSNVKG